MARPKHAALIAIASACTLLLAACGSAADADSGPAPSAGGGTSSWRTAVLDKAPVADEGSIPKDSSLWKAHEAGVLTYGGSKSQKLFSVLNPTTGELEGFDATMALLLAKYVTGKPKVDEKIVTSETRESLLNNGTIQAAIYTYSITEKREAKVDFAGPYFISGQGIVVPEATTDIKGLADLAGHKVCVTKGGTAYLTMKDKVPSAELITLESSSECEESLRQGHVDAEVQDRAILLGQVAKGGLKVVGDTVTYEPYGIGLPNNSPEAVAFVEAWLKDLIKSGIWQEVYDHTVGTVKDSQPQVPEPGRNKTPDLKGA